MGLHVGGIYVKADNKKVTQKSVANFIRDHWLKLGAKVSKKDPLTFKPLSLEKTGQLGFAITPKAQDIDGNLWIGIYDSERYNADSTLAQALALYFDADVWFYTINDSSNKAYAQKYGKKKEVVKNYIEALGTAGALPYPLLYFDKIQEDISENNLRRFAFLALEAIPHRPEAQYSGPTIERLRTNELIIKAKKYVTSRNGGELAKLAKNEDVYNEVIDGAIQYADPSNSKDLAFLYALAKVTIQKKSSCSPIAEAALRKKDEKMFAKAVSYIPTYSLFTLESRGHEIGKKGEPYLAFRLIEAKLFRQNYEDAGTLNNAAHFLAQTATNPGISPQRLKQFLKKAYEAGPTNPFILHNLACVYVKMKMYDKALICVSDAVKYNYQFIDKLKTDADLDPIKSDPRFKQAFE